MKLLLAFGKRMCYNPVNIIMRGGMRESANNTPPRSGAEEKAVKTLQRADGWCESAGNAVFPPPLAVA
jgi:hypothetical protein